MVPIFLRGSPIQSYRVHLTVWLLESIFLLFKFELEQRLRITILNFAWLEFKNENLWVWPMAIDKQHAALTQHVPMSTFRNPNSKLFIGSDVDVNILYPIYRNLSLMLCKLTQYLRNDHFVVILPTYTVFIQITSNPIGNKTQKAENFVHNHNIMDAT